MKYLVTFIFTIFSLNIFGDEDYYRRVQIVFVEDLSYEQQQNIIEIREDLLEKTNDIKEKMDTIRYETQNEMIKDNPNWNEIKRLNMEYSRLKRELNEEVLEYKEKIEGMRAKYAGELH